MPAVLGVSHGLPDVDDPPGHVVLDPSGHDADDRDGPAVHAHDPPDRAGIAAQALLPETLADDDHVVVGRALVGRIQGPAEDWGHPEDGEEPAAYREPAHAACGLAGLGQAEGLEAPGRRLLEDRCLLELVPHVGRRLRRRPVLGQGAEDLHEPAGIGDGKAVEQGIGQREGRRVDADSERERQEGDDREARVLEELPQCEFHGRGRRGALEAIPSAGRRSGRRGSRASRAASRRTAQPTP